MAGKRDLSGYNYATISFLVLTADRSALPRRDKEPGVVLCPSKNSQMDFSLVNSRQRAALGRRECQQLYMRPVLVLSSENSPNHLLEAYKTF